MSFWGNRQPSEMRPWTFWHISWDTFNYPSSCCVYERSRLLARAPSNFGIENHCINTWLITWLIILPSLISVEASWTTYLVHGSHNWENGRLVAARVPLDILLKQIASPPTPIQLLGEHTLIKFCVKECSNKPWGLLWFRAKWWAGMC